MLNRQFDMYFAGDGANLKYMLKSLPQYKEVVNSLNRLISYSYLEDEIIELSNNKDFKGKLMVDSGAFSVFKNKGAVDIDKYIEFINKYYNSIDYIIQLDVIPGAWGKHPTKEECDSSSLKTWENYVYMCDRVVCPEKLLPVFHQGEDFSNLIRILSHKINGKPVNYICLASNKSLNKNLRKEWYRECYKVIDLSINPNVKIHCLGCQIFDHLESFNWTSSDATSWLLSATYGCIFTDFGSVLVSSKKKDDLNHYINKSTNEKEAIADFVSKLGFDIYEMVNDESSTSFYTRLAYNIIYFITKTSNYSLKPINKTVIRRLI